MKKGNSRLQDGNGNGNGVAVYDIGAYEVVPSLSLSCTTDPYSVEATTELITYTITLQNNTGVDATGVTITSTIPNIATYKSGGRFLC